MTRKACDKPHMSIIARKALTGLLKSLVLMGAMLFLLAWSLRYVEGSIFGPLLTVSGEYQSSQGAILSIAINCAASIRGRTTAYWSPLTSTSGTSARVL